MKNNPSQIKNIISLHSSTADLQSNDRLVIKNGLRICDNCHVFESKCGCPKLCETCNVMTTRENLCECRQEYVQSLAAKISKSVGEPQHSKTDIPDERCEQIDYIPDSQQSGVSDIIDKHFDLMDLRPPEPGEEVDLSHCTGEQKVIVQELMMTYETAFARHRYDVGAFTGFVASIEVDPHASHIEK